MSGSTQSMRALYVIDSAKNLQKIPRGTPSDILIINYEPTELSGEIEWMKANGWEMDLLNLEQFINSSNDGVRNFYANSLASYIQQEYARNVCAQSDLLFLDFTETSTFKGRISNRLYNLALLNSVLADREYDKVIVKIRDKLLSQVMLGKSSGSYKVYPAQYGYWLQAIRFLIITSVTKIFSNALRINGARQELDYRAFTIYPYWWLKPHTEDPQDRFFPGLNKAVSGQTIGYLGWLEITPIEFLRNQSNLRDMIKNQRMEILNNYIPLNHLFQLFSLKKFLSFRRLTSAAGYQNKVNFLDFNVGQILRDEISRSIGSGEFARSRLIFQATLRYLANHRIKGILFRFENQPIDRAIIQASRGKTLSIGYWHSALAMCENYLSFWNLNGISKLSATIQGHSGTRPDAMLYANEICRGTLLREGFEESKIYNCGPTRHLEAIKIFKELSLNPTTGVWPTSVNQEAKSVIISFSADPAASKLMLRSALKSCSTFQNVTVHVKTHPAWRFTEADLQAFCLRYDLFKPKLVSQNENVYTQLAKTDLLITSGTQLAFESILLGVAPIVFESSSAFTPTNFSSFANVCFLATNIAELEQSIIHVISKSQEYEIKKLSWPKFLTNIFGDMNQNSDYGMLIKALAGITETSF